MPIQTFYNDIKYLFFFTNLINYEKKREEKLKIKNIQDSNGKFSLHYKSSCFKNHT